MCPTRELRQPWAHSLIVDLFNKGPGYIAIKRRLEHMWTLKGALTLVDIGNAHYWPSLPTNRTTPMS
ncbi:hypothetical protein V2J09_016360 [Rumex salicifolius]